MPKQKNIFFILMTCGVFAVLLLFDWLQEDHIFSSAENRMLAQKPAFGIWAVMDKSYMNGYEAYVTDQFVWRDGWIKLKTAAELALCKKDINGVYIGKDNYLIGQNTETYITEKNPKEKAKKLAALLSKHKEKLGPGRVAAMLVPTADNILTEKLPPFAGYFDQKSYVNQIETVEDALIDVSDMLDAHRQEYIYYKTDHHWTTLGAYYAYTAWAAKMGFTPWAIEDFAVETLSEDFYGTLYSKINMAGEPDKIERFLPKKEIAYEVYYDNNEEAADTLYEMKHLSTKNKYAVFLDDNHPFIRIHTGNANARNLLLVKDSYANCFAPFAANHYENVYMIDLRYYRGSIEDIVTKYGITDMLVLYDVIHFIENF